MLTSVFVVAPPGAYWPDLEIYTQPVAGAPLVLLEMTGLEPVSATVNSRPYGVQNGEFFSGAKVGKRNLVATFGLLTVGARDVFYAYFLPQNAIRLRLNFSDRDPVYIDGYVETNVPAGRFGESPEFRTMQASIICPMPNFTSEPKSVEHWSGPDPTAVSLIYSGTTGGGFTLELDVGDTNFDSPLIIVDSIGATERTMEFNSLSIVAGWRIFVSTHQGKKIVEFRPSGPLAAAGAKPTSFLGKMVDTYFWTQLFAGEHQIKVVTPDSATPRSFKIVYADQYAGV